MNCAHGVNFGLPGMAIIVTAYMLCHGLAAWGVAPLQEQILGEVTMFASLVYLPHGVRVLSVWLCGRHAVLPLMIGALLSELVFTEAAVQEITSSGLWLSIPIGALSAYVAFEILRRFGQSAYVGNSERMNWRRLIVVGGLASAFNSIGQTLAFSGVISPGLQLSAVITYAVGDMVGLVVTMLALMILFRTLRRGSWASRRTD